MKFLNFKRVLCLSPHPDDVEYSMLATIKKNSNTKFDIFCLSRGGAKGFDVTNDQYMMCGKTLNVKILNCCGFLIVNT